MASLTVDKGRSVGEEGSGVVDNGTVGNDGAGGVDDGSVGDGGAGSVGGGAGVGHLGDVAGLAVGGVGHGLDAAVGKVDGVGAGGGVPVTVLLQQYLYYKLLLHVSKRCLRDWMKSESELA